MSDPATVLAAIGVKSIFDATPQVVSSVTQAYVTKKQINAETFHKYMEASNPSLHALYAAITQIASSLDGNTKKVIEIIDKAQSILDTNMKMANTEAERACIRREVLDLVDKARQELDKDRYFKYLAMSALGGVATAALYVTLVGVRKAIIKV